MRITILTIGSRGDVQPYVALGLGLQAAGHKVRLATHTTFEKFVSSRGLDFASLEGNPQQWHDMRKREEKHSYLESGRNTIRYLRQGVNVVFRSSMEKLLADSWRACQGADAIIYSLIAVGGYHIAEKLGVPGYAAWYCPASRTRAFPSPIVQTGLSLGGTYNWLTYIFVEQLFWQSLQQSINQWRQETLNLPPIPVSGLYNRLQEQRVPFIYSYSPAVLPKPPDWHDSLHVTGYLFLERPPGWQPPADLVDFLASGPPPVYIGFGSMIGRNPEARTELVLKALAHTRHRGILDTGWGSLSKADLPDHVFQIDSESAPHDWLLPQMAAVIHHGGAGTTTAGLRAGLPSIIVPFVPEQFFWGQRVADLGVGPPPIPEKRLTAERLATAIRSATSDKAMQAKAADLGQRIRAEDGVARAVDVFHRHLP